jgi:hypothetical protein
MLLRYVKRPSINRSGKTYAAVKDLGFQQGLQAAIYKTLAVFMYRGSAFQIIVTCRKQIVHLILPGYREVILRKHIRENLNYDPYWSYRKL